MSSPLRIEGATLRETPRFLATPWLRYGLASGAAALAFAALASRATPSPGAQAFLICASVVMALGGLSLSRPRVEDASATLELTDDHLALTTRDTRTELLWSIIARWSVHTLPDGDCETLRLHAHDGRAWDLNFPSDEALTAVRVSLRRALGRRALTIPLRAGFDHQGWTALVVLLAVGAPMPLADTVMRTGGLLAGFVAWVAGFALAARLVMEVCVARVTVGGDGVALQRGGCERFIPWSAVTDVDWDEYGVLLRLSDGEEVGLPLLSASMVRAEGDRSVARAVRLRDALHERLRAGFDAWRAKQEADEGAEVLLDRRGRTLEDWRAAARSLLAHAAGYRSARLDPSVAERVIDDPTAPLERRVAAVWALRDHDGPRASTRVRVALEAAAFEPAREALDLAARDDLDEDALDRALEAARG